MPIYKIKAPNGKIYDIEAPENATDNELFGRARQLVEDEEIRKFRKESTGFFEAGKQGAVRGFEELVSTGKDVLPALGASLFGFDEYAKEKLEKAKQERLAREAERPPLFQSYKEIEGIGDFGKYVTEKTSEQLANIATALIPGMGLGAVASRTAATAAGKKLALEAAEKGLAGDAAAQFIQQGLRAAPEIATSTLRGEAAGAFLGSYALNAPEVFQNIYEYNDGQLAPAAAALFSIGGAALDSILPTKLASQLPNPFKAAVVGKVLEKSGMDKSLAANITASALKAAGVEGLTEGAQEAISIAAERFVSENPKVFGSKEWDRIMESAVAGAVSGGALGSVGGGSQALRARAEAKRKEAEEARIRGEEQLAQQREAEAAQLEQAAQAASTEIEALQRPTTEAEQEAYGVEKQAGPFSPVVPYGPITPKEYRKQETQLNKDRKELAKLLEELAPEKLDLVKLAERPPAIEQTLQKAGEPLEKLQERGMRKGELNLEEMRRVGWNEEWNTIVPNIAELTQPEFRKALTSDVTIPVETRQGIIESAKQLTLPDGKPIIPKTARYSYPDASSTKINDLRKISKDVFGVAPNAAIMREMAGRDIANPEDALFVRDTLDAFADSGKAPLGAADKIEKFLQLPQFKALEGAPSATGIDEQTGREGARVSGKRGRGAAPASVESTERGGVDALTGDAGQPVVGETPQPGALKTRPQAAPTPTAPQLTPEQEAARAEAEFLGEEQVPIEERGAVIRRKKLTPEETKTLEEEGVAAAKEETPAVEPLSKKEISKAVDAFFGSHYLDREKKLFLPKYEGPAFDATQRRLAETGDINGLIRNLLDSNKDPAIKQVLRRLRSLNLKTKVVIGDPVGEFALPALREPFVESKYRPSVVEWAKRNFGNREYYGTPVWQNFVAWFGDSKVVDEKGEPLVMYHGTARDIRAFKPKQANAIFVTPEPKFAETFSSDSRLYMDRNWKEFLTEDQERQAYEDVREQIKKDLDTATAAAGAQYRALSIDQQFLEKYRALLDLFNFLEDAPAVKDILRNDFPTIDSALRSKSFAEYGGAQRLYTTLIKLVDQLSHKDIEDIFPIGVLNARREYFPSGPNLMPLFVKAEKSFDFENEYHVTNLIRAVKDFIENPNINGAPFLSTKELNELRKLKDYVGEGKVQFRRLIENGDWKIIENGITQHLLRNVLGYDGFYMYETRFSNAFNEVVGGKNLAVYNQNQVKSVTNRGRFSERPPILGLPKAGAYDPDTDTIYLDPELGMNAHTFIHEVMHAAISNVLRNRSHPLTKEFEGFFVSIKDRLGDAYGGTDLQEFAAELISNPSFQAILKSIKTPRSESLFVNIIRKIAEFFGFAETRFGKALLETTALKRGTQFINDALDITSGMEPIPGEALFLTGDFKPIDRIQNAMPALVGDRIERARNTLSNITGSSMQEAGFGLLRLDNLRQIFAKQLPSIKLLQDLLEQRMGRQEADTNRINATYKRFVEIQQRFPEQMKTLSEIAIKASQAEVDILKPYEAKKPDAAKRVAHGTLQAQFQRLNPEVRGVYETARNDYDTAFKQYRKLIEDAAENMPGLAAKLKEEFERAHPLVGYVPFRRYGDFWLEFTDPETDAPVAMAFESIRERQKFIDQNMKGIDHRVYKNFESIQFNADRVPPTHFISQVITGLRQNKASEAQVNAVYQAYLAAFPAESMAKQFIKRRGIEGMSKDFVRDYGDLMMRWSRKLANSEFLPKIDQALSQIRQEAGEQAPNVQAAAQSILRQTDFFHNPTFGTLVNGGTALSFYEFMAGNISSGIINLTSLPLMVLPLLTGRFGFGAGGAIISAMKTATNQWQNDPKYKALYTKLMDHGQLEHTMAREVLEGSRKSTNEYSTLRARFEDLVALPFSVSEKFNRATTAIAAYDLELSKNGGNKEAAIQYALDTVREAHTSGMAVTGPRWLQTPFGRLFGTFKSIIWQQAYIIARAFHQAAKGEKAEIRNAARAQLLMTYGMATAFVGVKGMPFYGAMSVLAQMLNALFGDDDEPFDLDNVLRESLPMILNKGFFNYFFNIELSNRAAIATDLIFRDDPRGIAEHGYALSALQQAFGPAGSVLVNTERSIKMFKDGYIERAIETASPAAIRNMLKGVRYLTEGALTLKGDPIDTDISTYNGLMQIIGFAPADLSNTYESLAAGMEYQRKVLDRRDDALRLYQMAIRSGDMDLLDEVRDRIIKFNEANPRLAITSESLEKSTRATQAAQQSMINGVRFNKKLLPEIQEKFFKESAGFGSSFGGNFSGGGASGGFE